MLGIYNYFFNEKAHAFLQIMSVPLKHEHAMKKCYS